MILNILVPTDGSEAAQKDARYAIDLAQQLKCAIVGFYSAFSPLHGLGFMDMKKN